MPEKKIVEVKVTTDGGEVPVGIMNTEQALSLPKDIDVAVSHPDREAGATDKFVDREELKTSTQPYIERDRKEAAMRFPSPKTEDPAERFDEAKAVARDALDELLAAANEAGWGTQEIAVALEAAQSLKDANKADPDPADDPAISDAVREQIGHGERFD